jgi:succinyl-diaminopimelate desuccinylase
MVDKTMYKEKIDAYIDSKREEMLADLSELVKIDSQRTEAREGMPYGEGPAKALAAAKALMEKYGLSTRNYDNRVVTGDFSDEEKALDILAHLDVVPVTEDWTVTQPFEPKIVDGRIYGRGTADDKGPAIAALYAIRAIRELGLPLKKSVRLVLGSDEECGSSDLAYYYGIEEEAPYTFTPDADFPLINIEKGRFSKSFSASYEDNGVLPKVVSMKSGSKVNVVPQKAETVVAGLEKSVIEAAAAKVSEMTGVSFTVTEASDKCDHAMAYTIHARGQAAHASTPYEGKNALTATLELLALLPFADSEGYSRLMGLHQMFPYADTFGEALGIKCSEPQSGELTMCFSVLDYTATGVRGEFDTRLPICCNKENTAVPVEKAFASHKLELADVNISEPHCVPGDSWFVQTLLGSYERYSGVKGEPLSTGGGTYVHHLKRGVAFGCMTPDVDNHMHGDDEFMVIDRLLMSAKIFADAILKICG